MMIPSVIFEVAPVYPFRCRSDPFYERGASINVKDELKELPFSYVHADKLFTDHPPFG